jgi:hypothetical protein
MQYTGNYNLKKPDGTDAVNIQDLNDNADIIDQQLNDNKSGLSGHVSNKSNPHVVTKAQVGLANVDNYQQATKLEFNSHVGDKSNPHNVTKSQVGLGSVDNVQQATKTEFNSHAGDTSNPHSVTKSQVGLGSVSNYGIATLAEAQTGISGTKYMTPLRTKDAIDSLHANRTDNPHNVTKSQVGLGNVADITQASKADFDNHVANKSNPHTVTKSQVGLGSVYNYGIATQLEAETGTSNTEYMTPLRTKEAIQKLAPKPVASTVSIADTGGHFSATNVEGALSELFTNVSNGKSLVSGAITDTDPRVQVPTNPTFNELSNAVKQIKTGKQWASGTAISSTDNDYDFATADGRITQNYSIEHVAISGLGFDPSYMILRGVGNSTIFLGIYFKEGMVTGGDGQHPVNYFKSANATTTSFINYTNSFSSTYDMDKGNGIFILPVTHPGINIEWEAYE